MLKEVLFTLLLIPLLLMPSLGQVSGVVTNDEGDVLPFATVAIGGTSKGTVANNEGLYEISVPEGNVTLIFQYIGYKTEYVDITYSGQPLSIDISLIKQAIDIDEIVIAADAEDPAYGIMRKVIANRERQLKAVQNFRGDVYIKGQIKVLEAPEKFMGQEVGNMEGLLDTTGQGIVYLSESKSTVYFNYPAEFKEVMNSSIVAGDDSGFSFNQFSMANFNFYFENIRFDRSLNTPLNDNALSNYKFKLLGTFMDQQGRLINQIEVKPIHDNYPLFNGMLYIVDGEWVIHSLDLSFSGKAIKNRFFDFIRIRQVMRYDNNKQLWYLNNQIIDFESGFFSFRFGGSFSYVFNDVILNEGPYEIGDEIFAMEEDALDRPTNYWDSIRPIPLTIEEEKDYIKKDSLEILWKSKEYLDSLDQRNNKLSIGSLFFGYSHNSTFKDQYYRVRSPLTSVSFNTVEGFSMGVSGNYRKYSDEDDNRLFIAPSIRYGFSDEQLKYEVRSNYRFSRKRFSFLTLNGGRVLDQFDNRDPVSTGLNTWGSLVRKENLLKLYRKDYLTLQYQQEVFNGLYAWIGFHHENRKRVDNNSDFSIFRKDGVYEGNLPFKGIDEGLISDNSATRLSFTLRWRPGQKYLSYPNLKLRIPSDWPDFYVFYDKGLRLFDSNSDFDKLRFRIAKARVDIGEKGYFGFQLEGGRFLSDQEVFFVDYFHFATQPFKWAFYERYLSQFKLLGLYLPSTIQDYSTFFLEYHFDGYFMDRIPFFRNTALKMVLGYGGLFTVMKPYHEFSLGIENIGIGPLSFLRLDYVWSVQGSEILDHGIKIGLSQVINGFAN